RCLRDGAGMIKQKSQILCAWFLLWDLAMTGLAWLLAYFLRLEPGLLALNKEPPSFALCFTNLPLVVLLGALAYRLTDQYAVHRFRRLREERFSVLQGLGVMD